MSFVEPKAGRVAPWIQTNWDLRAAGNFIGGGSGTGLLIVAAFAAGAAYRPFALLGLALVALGLFSVFLEIGRHLRAPRVLAHVGRSWMTREAIVAPLLFAAGLAAAWTETSALAGLTALLAAAYLHCQARIVHAAKGIPAWREPRIVPLLMVAGLAEGAGLLVLVLALLDRSFAVRWPALALAVLLVARTVAWRGYRKRLQAPAAALAALDSGRRIFDRLGNWVAAPIAVVASLLAPGPLAAALAATAGALAVLLVARTVAWRGYRKRLQAPAAALAALDAGRRIFDRLGNWVAAPVAVVASLLAPGPLAAGLAVAAGALAVVCGWHFKVTLITRAAHNQGFALPALPVRGKGSVGAAAKPGW